ncbi:MAG: MFS transporter [Syntrophales bacterium]
MNNDKGIGIGIFTLLSSVWGVVYGLVGPFYVLYVSKISGTTEKLGIAFSIMVLVQSLTSYVVGRYSDKLGRKPFLLMIGLLDASILLAYTVADKTYHIYILQGLLGVTNAMGMTVRGTILGDLTKRERRGTDIGKYNAIVGIFSAIGIVLGGFITKIYGLKSIFYLGAAVIFISTILIFFIPEPKDVSKSD